MSPEKARRVGQDIREFLEQKGRALDLDNDEILNLVLVAAYGWAEASGLNPKKDPRPMFERAARIWDALSREQRIEVVHEFKGDGKGNFGL